MQIRSGTYGFQKSFSCFPVSEKEKVPLITLADASNTGFTACTYLFIQRCPSVSLPKAKSKLVSMRGKRIDPNDSNDVLHQRCARAGGSVLNIQGVYVFSDLELVSSCVKQSHPETGVAELNKISGHKSTILCHVWLCFLRK